MMTTLTDELPPLPEPAGAVDIDCGQAPGGGRELVCVDGYTADQMQAYARAAIAAHEARNVPDGWKLVPIEPTEAMVFAMDEVIEKPYNRANKTHKYQAKHTYKAMLASAPPAPSTSVPHEAKQNNLAQLVKIADDQAKFGVYEAKKTAEPVWLAIAQVQMIRPDVGMVTWLPHQGSKIKVGDYLYTRPQPAKREPLTDEQQIAEALRKYVLKLTKINRL